MNRHDRWVVYASQALGGLDSFGGVGVFVADGFVHFPGIVKSSQRFVGVTQSKCCSQFLKIAKVGTLQHLFVFFSCLAQLAVVLFTVVENISRAVTRIRITDIHQCHVTDGCVGVQFGNRFHSSRIRESGRNEILTPLRFLHSLSCIYPEGDGDDTEQEDAGEHRNFWQVRFQFLKLVAKCVGQFVLFQLLFFLVH